MANELIGNPGAELATTGWSSQNGGIITRDNTHVFEGLWAFKLVTPGATTAEGMQFDQGGPNIAGAHPSTLYTYTARVFSVAGGERITLAMQDYTAANVLINTSFSGLQTLAVGWNLLSMTFTTAATAARIEPYVTTDTTAPNQAVTIWVDSLSIPDRVQQYALNPLPFVAPGRI